MGKDPDNGPMDRAFLDPSPLPGPDRWAEQDLVGVSWGMDPSLVLRAYANGMFPMPIDDLMSDVGPGDDGTSDDGVSAGDPLDDGALDESVSDSGTSGEDPSDVLPPSGWIGWYSPVWRGILPLDGLRVTRSLRKSAKHFRVTVDRAFDEVLAGCGRPDRDGGWIDDTIVEVYTRLFRAGRAHSVECWTADGQLAGGLYGVAYGGLFAGESMFHDPRIGRDASKTALMGLVAMLRAAPRPERRLLDVQWRTEHLGTLGVIEVHRSEYLRLLRRAIALPQPRWEIPDDWRTSCDGGFPPPTPPNMTMGPVLG